MTCVLVPECRFGVHGACRTAEVVVEGIVIVRARRCDCPCHENEKPRKSDEGVPALRTADQRRS
jgi:hypothetical protein